MSLFDLFFGSPKSSHTEMASPEINFPKSLILYKFDGCIFCRRVMAFIEKHQLPVTYLDIRKQPEYRQDLLRMNGKGQVPCLLIDGHPLLESEDIIRYLKKVFNL